eukprot:TRINITY_DN2962_c0_g1_i1.p2 TRINITY_DN2962_c0_g1~~TRINITY_DN2962_c0_g1_i1.p2  ORF type:complete len:186 (-),score=31.43 TRINITY_DN2962_c0_g1_i1:34-591(-)
MEVVKKIQQTVPNITTFSTLSPIPGFRKWLETQLALESNTATTMFPEVPLLTKEEVQFLETYAASASLDTNPITTLKDILNKDWSNDQELEPFLKKLLTRLTARYLVNSRKRGLALDPVANFHLQNGAQVYSINWKGNISPQGMRQSYGLMVNYLYNLPDLKDNSSNYIMKHQISVSDAVRQYIP